MGKTRSPRAGILQKTNTSTIPGIRIRWRYPKWGAPRLGIDVTWFDTLGQRHSTTMPATFDGFLDAVELREESIGRVIEEANLATFTAMVQTTGPAKRL